MATRSALRKVVFWIAVASFVASVAAVGGLAWSIHAFGMGHVASASLFAGVLFLASCGVVLYFMSVPPRRPDPPGSEERP